MKSAPFIYEAARSVDHALELFDAAEGYAKYIAGGQTLGPMLNLRLTQVDTLIDISRIEECRRADETASSVIFGANIRHAEFEDGKVPDASLGLMRRVAGTLAYRAVRNRGTLGGSLAHADPVAEWPSVMVALSATVHVRGRSGQRSLPVADFLVTHLTSALDEDEIVTGIEVPRMAAGSRVGFRKFCRKAGEFAHSLAVAVVPPQGPARLVLGCAAGTPILLERTSQIASGVAQWTTGQDGEVRRAIADDLAEKASDLDDYDTHLHASVAIKALREALTA